MLALWLKVPQSTLGAFCKHHHLQLLPFVRYNITSFSISLNYKVATYQTTSVWKEPRKDGTIINADINAALNMIKKYKRNSNDTVIKYLMSRGLTIPYRVYVNM